MLPKDCYDCNCGWCTEAWDIKEQRPDDCPLEEKEKK